MDPRRKLALTGLVLGTGTLALAARSFEEVGHDLLVLQGRLDVIQLELVSEMEELVREVFLARVEQNPTWPAFAEREADYLDVFLEPSKGIGGAMIHSRETVGGGVVDGPARIRSVLSMDMLDPSTDLSVLPLTEHVEHFRVATRLESPWRVFAGVPVLEIEPLGGDLVDAFIDRYCTELDRHGIAYELVCDQD